jgi:ribosomal protein L37AE/L43A
MSHCSEHGIDYSGHQCPRCAADEHQARVEELASEQLDELQRIQYKQANPGDYECPHCKYKTLKRRATRCPTCRESPGEQYWLNVEAKERKEESDARERARRNAEIAAAAAVAAANRLKREKPLLKWVKFWHHVMIWYYLWLVPLLVYVTGAEIFLWLNPNTGNSFSLEKVICMVIPGVNWLCLLLVCVSVKDDGTRPVLLVLAISWAIVGLPLIWKSLSAKKALDAA